MSPNSQHLKAGVLLINAQMLLIISFPGPFLHGMLSRLHFSPTTSSWGCPRGISKFSAGTWIYVRINPGSFSLLQASRLSSKLVHMQAGYQILSQCPGFSRDTIQPMEHSLLMHLYYRAKMCTGAKADRVPQRPRYPGSKIYTGNDTQWTLSQTW
jgi:hypothetical protein